MKVYEKVVVLFVVITFLAAFTLIGCNQSTPPVPEKGAPGAPGAPTPAPEIVNTGYRGILAKRIYPKSTKEGVERVESRDTYLFPLGSTGYFANSQALHPPFRA